MPADDEGADDETARIELRLPAGFITRMRNAIAHTRHHDGEARNPSEFAYRHLLPPVEDLEHRSNAGEPFPPGDIPPGPPPGYRAGVPKPPRKPPTRKETPP
jgi:hypothetical protein